MMIEYRSTDSSHPAVSGQAGALKNALKAILVDGYGAKAAAGWTLEYESGNFAAFRQGGGHRRWLAVNDDDAQMCRLIGYDSMTSATAGTGRFPLNAQFAGGLYARKSITASSTERPWVCWADDTTFYMTVQGGLTTLGAGHGGDAGFAFGQTVGSEVAGDLANTFLIAATDTSTTSTSGTPLRQPLSQFGTSASSVNYMRAAWSQMTEPVTMVKCASVEGTVTSSGVTGNPIVPSKVALARIYLREGNVHRGMLPGLWVIPQLVSYSQFDTMSGATGDALEGRTFLLFKVTLDNYIAVETTEGSWNG